MSHDNSSTANIPPFHTVFWIDDRKCGVIKTKDIVEDAPFFKTIRAKYSGKIYDALKIMAGSKAQCEKAINGGIAMFLCDAIIEEKVKVDRLNSILENESTSVHEKECQAEDETQIRLIDTMKKSVEKLQVASREVDESIQMLSGASGDQNIVEDLQTVPLVPSMPLIRVSQQDYDTIEVIKIQYKNLPEKQSKLSGAVLNVLFGQHFSWRNWTLKKLAASEDKVIRDQVQAVVRFMQEVYKEHYDNDSLDSVVRSKASYESKLEKSKAAKAKTSDQMFPTRIRKTARKQ